jgi:Clr5 domain
VASGEIQPSRLVGSAKGPRMKTQAVPLAHKRCYTAAKHLYPRDCQALTKVINIFFSHLPLRSLNSFVTTAQAQTYRCAQRTSQNGAICCSCEESLGFTQLYSVEDRSLEEVMGVMETEYGFIASYAVPNPLVF